jgi:xylulokinase
MRLLFGIDVGTQGTKTVLYREDGVYLAEAFIRSRPRHPAPGAVEEDPEDQVGSVLGTIRECLAQAGADAHAVAGLAVVGQMAGVIGIDAAGRAITPYDSWLDTRCSPYIERMRTTGDLILRRTGNAPSFNHGPKILWWKHEQPQIYGRIARFVQPGAYVAMRLCGLDAESAFIDPTYLHFSGFADNVALRWDHDLCGQHNVDRSKLPRIVPSTDVVGRLNTGMAASCGLRSGTPIVAGCGDTAASFLACGASEPGVCIDVAGTAAVFAATIDHFIPDTRHGILGCGRSVFSGLWHPYAYINGGGQNLEWFRTSIAANADGFAALDAAAADASSDENLPYFVPHLGGRVSPAWPRLRGSWAGLDWSATQATLYRAILESVALEYALYRNTVIALCPGFRVREIRITGGGEKSMTWNQLKANRLQARVVGIQRGGGAPLGATLLAGVGTGVLPELRSAAGQWIALDRGCEPDPATAELSERRTQRYAALLQSLHAWSITPNTTGT